MYNSSKTRVIPKSKAGNISPDVARSRGTSKIAINKIAAWVAVTWIRRGNVELLLALETAVQERKAVNRIVLWCIVSHIETLGEVIRLPQYSAAIPLGISHKPDLRRLVLSLVKFVIGGTSESVPVVFQACRRHHS